eukprot:975832-Amorphochlora_amoeboformis.AAC.1
MRLRPNLCRKIPAQPPGASLPPRSLLSFSPQFTATVSKRISPRNPGNAEADPARLRAGRLLSLKRVF